MFFNTRITAMTVLGQVHLHDEARDPHAPQAQVNAGRWRWNIHWTWRRSPTFTIQSQHDDLNTKESECLRAVEGPGWYLSRRRTEKRGGTNRRSTRRNKGDTTELICEEKEEEEERRHNRIDLYILSEGVIGEGKELICTGKKNSYAPLFETCLLLLRPPRQGS